MRSLILGGLVAAAQPKVISGFTGRVVGVTDGDTAKVLVASQTITLGFEHCLLSVETN
jgi:hypothetical protein